MVSKKRAHRTLDEIHEDLAKRGITEQDVADAVKWVRQTESKSGVLVALRRWPIAGLNLKRPRAKPRKIDL
jgi:hypothetical protein